MSAVEATAPEAVTGRPGTVAAPYDGGGRARGPGGVRRELRAVRVLWHREMVRLLRTKVQIVMGLVTPVMFLLVMGTGLESMGAVAGDAFAQFRGYLFPGVLVMATQAPALAVGLSVMMDRQTGMLRQAMVAPVRRVSLLLGLSLGGATCGAVYGALVLAISGAVGIAYHPLLLVALLEVAVIALLFTAGGMLAAVTIQRIQTFQVLMGLALMPLMFLSGAMFSPTGLPRWLGIVVHLNPLTYAVDAVRRTLPGELDMGGYAGSPQIADWTPPVAVEVCFVAVLAVGMLVVAARRFSRRG
ncbi:ABC transporter permease [Streptomyces albus]|uniref:ABC transporter permease n=1 Tax=Streptomyces sp. PHES57 TaxID=2872626 RepID=UPI001CECB2BE|nr:ABC transporter permease [Streptomyces sp. PHES57]